MLGKLCSVEACDAYAYRKGMCSKHYQRVMRHGDPHATKRYEGQSCRIDGCARKARSHQLCGTHYMRLRRHGSPYNGAAVRRFGCIVDGCDGEHKAQGYCRVHYDRLLAHGDPRGDIPVRASPGEPMDWLLAHANHDDAGCLPWPYARDSKGYAQIHLPDGRKVQATRVMCAEVHGEAPTPEHQAAHGCGNGHGGCIHPAHLRWATVVENHADKIEHGTSIRGEQQHNAKVTRDQVLAIRAMAGSVSQAAIGEMFGISQTSVGKIIRRKNWAWLDVKEAKCEGKA